jgi:hypothetical protein
MKILWAENLPFGGSARRTHEAGEAPKCEDGQMQKYLLLAKICPGFN